MTHAIGDHLGRRRLLTATASPPFLSLPPPLPPFPPPLLLPPPPPSPPPSPPSSPLLPPSPPPPFPPPPTPPSLPPPILGALGLALGFLIGPAAAQTGRTRAGAHGGCSLHTLHGTYAGNLSGTSTATGPLALQVLVTFHGNGKASAVGTVMTEKQGPVHFTSKTTYTLKRNCTGTLVAMRTPGRPFTTT